jgi:hypothetical protein
MPHQEFYLAALDRQSCTAMEKLATLMADSALAAAANAQAVAIAGKLDSEYFDTQRQFYAFSRNANGSLDRTATAFPGIAWWDGTLALPRAGNMLDRWASDEFSTDWGVRDVSRNESIYDPISYHQGSVWPLYTGWISLAEYRAGRPAAGFAHLMQNADLTFAQDLGAVTELLSGDFYQPFGRSSSHQLWSSAMVVTPALRGLFGLETDALRHIVHLHPQLPATWDSAALRNVAMGASRFDLTFRKEGGKLLIDASSEAPQLLCLTSDPECVATTGLTHNLEIALPAFEVELPHGLPSPGSSTAFARIVSQSEAGFEIEGLGGSLAEVDVRFGRAPRQIAGATLNGAKLSVRLPPGDGYRRATVSFTF